MTVGQAFGGDLEAVTVHTGLLAARHVLGADLAIVTQGPGNLGTGTPWGFSGVAAGEACNAVTVLGGEAIGALRISDADPRPRHRGVSHHSLTAFGRVALGGVTLVAPRGLTSELGGQVDEDLAGQPGRNPVVWVDTDGLDDALVLSPVPLRTMGRGYPEERAYFLAAAAAGRFAALRVPVPGADDAAAGAVTRARRRYVTSRRVGPGGSRAGARQGSTPVGTARWPRCGPEDRDVIVQAADPIDPERINIFERWESDEDLHRFRTSGGPTADTPPLRDADVHKYRIAAVEEP